MASKVAHNAMNIQRRMPPLSLQTRAVAAGFVKTSTQCHWLRDRRDSVVGDLTMVMSAGVVERTCARLNKFRLTGFVDIFVAPAFCR
jgi:hypothetical protein